MDGHRGGWEGVKCGERGYGPGRNVRRFICLSALFAFAGGVTDVPLVLHLDNDLSSSFKPFLISPPLNARLRPGGVT